MRKWIKLSNETQEAAKWCASRGYDGKEGCPLPENLSAKSLQEINKNKTCFRLCVHIFKADLRFAKAERLVK